MVAGLIIYRQARQGDLQELVDMLAEDELGVTREDPSSPLNPRYQHAFDALSEDPNNELIVVELAGRIVGMMQLTRISGLSHLGSTRCLTEGVRIRGSERPDALRFYESQGFQATHEGFKRKLRGTR